MTREPDQDRPGLLQRLFGRRRSGDAVAAVPEAPAPPPPPEDPPTERLFDGVGASPDASDADTDSDGHAPRTERPTGPADETTSELPRERARAPEVTVRDADGDTAPPTGPVTEALDEPSYEPPSTPDRDGPTSEPEPATAPIADGALDDRSGADAPETDPAPRLPSDLRADDLPPMAARADFPERGEPDDEEPGDGEPAEVGDIAPIGSASHDGDIEGSSPILDRILRELGDPRALSFDEGELPDLPPPLPVRDDPPAPVAAVHEDPDDGEVAERDCPDPAPDAPAVRVHDERIETRPGPIRMSPSQATTLASEGPEALRRRRRP